MEMNLSETPNTKYQNRRMCPPLGIRLNICLDDDTSSSLQAPFDLRALISTHFQMPKKTGKVQSNILIVVTFFHTQYHHSYQTISSEQIISRSMTIRAISSIFICFCDQKHFLRLRFLVSPPSGDGVKYRAYKHGSDGHCKVVVHLGRDR